MFDNNKTLILIHSESDEEIIKKWVTWLIVVFVIVFFLLYSTGALDRIFSDLNPDQTFGSPYT